MSRDPEWLENLVAKMPKKQDLIHVLRVPLPWRHDDPATECGRDPSLMTTMSHDDFVAQCKQWGQQRAAMLTCMTCLSTVQNWLHAKDSLIAQIGREIDRSGRKYARSDGDPHRLEHELRAIALLVEAHRLEFEETLADLTGAVSLDKLRAERRAKKRYV